MTNKKSVARKNTPAVKSTRLDAATLRNLALQPESLRHVPDDAALQPIADMLAKLSPSNLQMVENIIRVIVDEQSRDSN